jgi:hypothetical protein
LSWDALGALEEITGAFAVVISLVYLATQIKTQNREARIASVHEISEAFRMGITSFQDAQRANVYTKALKVFDDLNDSEKLQFISMVQGLLRVWEIRKHTYNPDFQKYVNELDFGEYRLS